MITWTDESCMIAKYFTVKDALMLHKWNRLAVEADGLTEDVKKNLITLFQKMDLIREFFNKPIIVHVSYRPAEYNKLVGGADTSAHLSGKACDFHFEDLSITMAQNIIMRRDMLMAWDVRMEQSTPTWIHIGNDYSGQGNRYFIP